ncbi:afadin- and alpha-actinin-binding protein-like isoform X2 [Engraulis encrasicolus]|uniref:afadin- and alpha-actinin-binding protein-like isoform X2 n=1 Tax=Engraulis encrasicolus TaxID=184585 RepID=UPI002FD4682B
MTAQLIVAAEKSNTATAPSTHFNNLDYGFTILGSFGDDSPSAVMPESTQEFPDISYDSYINKASPLEQYTQSTNFYSPVSDFCTDDNIPECILYLNQEAASLGFPCVQVDPEGVEGSVDIDMVSLLNSMYGLVERHHRVLRALDQLEAERLRNASDMQRQQLNQGRLKDQLEITKRENARLQERERQLHLNIKSLKKCLKSERDEVQKLQNIRASRSRQYSHDMKRKEREYYKLKEHLNQLLTDKKDSKQAAIEVLNCVGRSDGKRSQWKTRRVEASHEEEMYQVLLRDFESRQRELLLENAELRKVLTQIKKEMVSILSPKQHTYEPQEQGSEEEGEGDGEGEGVCEREVVCEAGREEVAAESCGQAREELTNSIRLQWRKFKHHVEQLDTQASLVQRDGEVMAKDAHDKEMEHLRQEIQQCKDFIHTQQQLLQQLSAPCDEETALLLKDCYMLEEKERLKEEWRLFEEQRKTFASERQNFTEAAIRLGRERKMFEEDRATWLKHQFLNLSFADHMASPVSKPSGAISEYVESSPAPSSLSDMLSQLAFSPPEVSSTRPSPQMLFSPPELLATRPSSTRPSSSARPPSSARPTSSSARLTSSVEYQLTHMPQSRF